MSPMKLMHGGWVTGGGGGLEKWVRFRLGVETMNTSPCYLKARDIERFIQYQSRPDLRWADIANVESPPLLFLY